MNGNKRNLALIVPIMAFLAACSESDPAPVGFDGAQYFRCRYTRFSAESFGF